MRSDVRNDGQVHRQHQRGQSVPQEQWEDADQQPHEGDDGKVQLSQEEHPAKYREESSVAWRKGVKGWTQSLKWWVRISVLTCASITQWVPSWNLLCNAIHIQVHKHGLSRSEDEEETQGESLCSGLKSHIFTADCILSKQHTAPVGIELLTHWAAEKSYQMELPALFTSP